MGFWTFNPTEPASFPVSQAQDGDRAAPANRSWVGDGFPPLPTGCGKCLALPAAFTHADPDAFGFAAAADLNIMHRVRRVGLNGAEVIRDWVRSRGTDWVEGLAPIHPDGGCLWMSKHRTEVVNEGFPNGLFATWLLSYGNPNDSVFAAEADLAFDNLLALPAGRFWFLRLINLDGSEAKRLVFPFVGDIYNKLIDDGGDPELLFDNGIDALPFRCLGINRFAAERIDAAGNPDWVGDGPKVRPYWDAVVPADEISEDS